MINLEALKNAKKVTVTYMETEVTGDDLRKFQKLHNLSDPAFAHCLGLTERQLRKNRKLGKSKLTGPLAILFQLLYDDPTLIDTIYRVEYSE